MRVVIENESYDTDNAEQVAIWESAYPCPHPRHCEEALYRTNKGVWFIWGSGGALTPWAQQVGRDYVSGQGVRILAWEQIRQWCKDREINHIALEEYGATV